MRPTRLATLAIGATVLATAAALSAAAHAPSSAHRAAVARRVQSLGTVNLAQLAALPPPSAPQAVRYSVQPDLERSSAVDAAAHPRLPLGARTAPASAVVTGGGGGDGFSGISITQMEKAGTGQYAGTNGGLEPPDQALCVGNGHVLEGVNMAWRVWTTAGTPLTKAVPITQFFRIAPSSSGPSAFVADPRCVFDPQTGRFFAMTLEADEASGATEVPFLRSHTYFAVSKTGDPTGDWSVFSFDVTDDGQMGTPLHPSCPCLDDQPLMGLDAHGLYITANEYSDTEILPVAPPSQFYTVLGMLPDYRSGQSQVYALSKTDLVHGTAAPVQAFDTATVPVPSADTGKPGTQWSSVQPASSPPHDRSPEPPGGAEYFLSQLDFSGSGDNRIAVWALTGTASLDSGNPALHLMNTVITTRDASETYAAPSYGVDQKDGPHPLGDRCSCPIEQLNANDDRMNEVMLTNGVLWGALNTALPATEPGATGRMADPRAGIMYFAVRPQVSAGGQLTATMVRDGYVQVPVENVIFPSIAASPAGPVVMFFALTGVDWYPSTAWARLDGLAPGHAPVVHVSAAGTAPEDGFTGYPLSSGILPLDPQSGSGVSRWGDYTFAEVDEHGCLWGSAEYIPKGARDPNAGNWGTFITRVQPAGCSEPALATH